MSTCATSPPGSDALLTNTFGANAVWLDRFGGATEVAAINRRPSRSPARPPARAVRPRLDRPDGRRFRAGTRPRSWPSAGVDGVILETHRSSRALAAWATIRGAVDLPIVVSLFAFDEPVADAARRLVDAGADVVGINCVRPDRRSPGSSNCRPRSPRPRSSGSRRRPIPRPRPSAPPSWPPTSPPCSAAASACSAAAAARPRPTSPRSGRPSIARPPSGYDGPVRSPRPPRGHRPCRRPKRRRPRSPAASARSRREDLKAGECLCDHCYGKCCRYFSLPIDTPDDLGRLRLDPLVSRPRQHDRLRREGDVVSRRDEQVQVPHRATTAAPST